jgi:hypothetical protein
MADASKETLEDSAQRGADFLVATQVTGLGWGTCSADFKATGTCTTEITCWVIAALSSARLAEITVGDSAFDGGRALLIAVTDPETGGVGAETRGDAGIANAHAERLTAMAVTARLMTGEKRSDEAIVLSAKRIAAALPTWDPEKPSLDLAYAYWGSLAMFQMGGEMWGPWREAMREIIYPRYRRADDGDLDGSVDPSIDPTASGGGRVYATAMTNLVASGVAPSCHELLDLIKERRSR